MTLPFDVADATEPDDTPKPTGLADWRQFIPEHVTFAPTTSRRNPCACPSDGALALHISECAQGAAGQAQPYGAEFCDEYGLQQNVLVTATGLGAALRGISEDGLADTLAWEADDRDFVAEVRAARAPELNAKLDADFAEATAVAAQLDGLFGALRPKITAAELDEVLDAVNALPDTAAIEAHLQARLDALGDGVTVARAAENSAREQRIAAALATFDAAATAPPFMVPPAPSAVPPGPGVVPPPTATVPPAASAAPTPGSDPDAVAASEAQADAIAVGRLEYAQERGQLTGKLAPHLQTIQEPSDQIAELDALMNLTLAERAEVMDAVAAGRLARLDLRIRDLTATAKGPKQAWLRLREGAAGKWSVAELTPFTKEQLREKMNGSPRVPTIMQLFYDTSIHLLAGSGGIGKTWIALAACKSVLPPVPIPGRSGPYAMYLDMDQNGDELYQRAGWLGVPEEDLLSRNLVLMDVSAEAAERGAGTVALLRSILEGLLEAPPKVVVVDSLTRITSDIGADSDNGDAITAVLGMFNELARVSCVIVLDHTGHGDQTRPKGSGAKKDASHVVHSVEAIPLDPERNPDAVAMGKVHSTKDRFGGIRRVNRDPANRDSIPVLGLISVSFDEAENRAQVAFVSQSLIAGAAARRETDTGQAFTAEAEKVLRRVIDAAARAAVNAHDAKARGCKPVPPLSARGAEEAAWAQLRNNELGGRKSDVRDALKKLAKEGAVVEYLGEWGSVSGVRLRCRGGITGAELDPVDLD